jgi:hypothetical protein
MKTLNKTLLAAGLMLVATVPAYADHNDWKGGIGDRLERQHSRIEHGIDTGKLTRKEAKELRREQRKTRHLYREFREDGYLSKRERRKLRHRLDRVSDQIWDLKHNARSRERSDHRYGYDWHDDGGWPRHHRHDHHNRGWYW